MKKFLHKLFFPNWVLGFFLFLFGFGLLIYVFACHLEGTPLSYVSYLLSTYSLILFCIWFYQACRFSTDWVKETKLYQFYEKNLSKIMKITLSFSTLFNIAYAIFNLIIGIYYRSYWFFTFAVYYFLLSFMRVSLLARTKELNQDGILEYRKLKRCGIVSLFLNVVFAGMVVLILHSNQTIVYAGSIIYVVALYDFYLISVAIYNAIRYRKANHPLILASKCINLTVAMISMLSLEVAMIERFGDDTSFKIIMTGSGGVAIVLINSIIALYMIVKSNRNIRKIQSLTSKTEC